MSVYVDDVEHAFGRMKMCHMWADTLDELLEMADAIGVQRKWLQRPPNAWSGADPRYTADDRLKPGMKASWVHFDIALVKKRMALERGAILTDQFGPGVFEAKLCIASGRDDIVAIGKRKLAMFEGARERRS